METIHNEDQIHAPCPRCEKELTMVPGVGWRCGKCGWESWRFEGDDSAK